MYIKDFDLLQDVETGTWGTNFGLKISFVKQGDTSNITLSQINNDLLSLLWIKFVTKWVLTIPGTIVPSYIR